MEIFLSKGDVGDSDSGEEVEEVLSGIEDAEVADRDSDVANKDADVVDGEVQQRQQQETVEPCTSRRTKAKPKPPPPVWVEVSDVNRAKQIPVWLDLLPEPNEVDTPVDYFRKFVDDNIVKIIVEQSNLHSIQKNPNKPLNLTSKELEQYIGVCIGMSIYDLPRSRIY